MSTTPNYRELFNAYHNGFDNYGAWFEHHKAMHAKHPLECAEFGAEWLRRWEAVGRLLEAPALVRIYNVFTRRFRTFKSGARSTAKQLETVIGVRQRTPNPVRIVLLDGTIVKEWGVT